jgi:hypothetical protein
MRHEISVGMKLQLNSTLNISEWLPSRSGRFNTGKGSAPTFNTTQVGVQSGYESFGNRKISKSCYESNQVPSVVWVTNILVL